MYKNNAAALIITVATVAAAAAAASCTHQSVKRVNQRLDHYLNGGGVVAAAATNLSWSHDTDFAHRTLPTKGA